jgi:hypothetical protein
MRFKKFNLGPLPVEIHFYFGKEKEFIKIAKEKYKQILAEGFGGWTLNCRDTQIMWVKSKDLGITVHECYHAVENILKGLGADGESECGAYLMEYLVEQCLEVVK